MIFPQVLLLGNGLNRSYGGADWSVLLNEIHDNPRIPKEHIQNLAFPLQAVLATDDHIDSCLKDKNKRKLFYGLMDIETIRPTLEILLDIPFDHILTTNYSYELERVAIKEIGVDGYGCQNIMHTLDNKRAEQKYLLHTYNEISFHGHDHIIWHIHGEARKADSIILGHYYYGNLLARYQAELKKTGDKQFIRQNKGEEPIIHSWLDAFIMGDVYVLGFGYDFSEMDLWWLLNRKKREHADHGKLHFYSHTEGEENKLSLMKTYDTIVHDLGYYHRPQDFKAFYRDAIEDIRLRVIRKDHPITP